MMSKAVILLLAASAVASANGPTTQPASQPTEAASQSGVAASQPVVLAPQPGEVVEPNSIQAAWSSHIQAPPIGPDEDLQEAIRRLNTVRMPPPEGGYDSGPLPAIEPEKTSQEVAVAAPTSQPTSRPADEVEATLAKLTEGVDAGTADPVALADALFLSKRYEAALRFYEKAYETESDANEKAWLLFQAGNCRMRIDSTAAAVTYGRLLEDHPDSPFCKVASARKQFIEWREKNDVAGLLAHVRQKDSR